MLDSGNESRCLIVLAFDRVMFAQAMQCIATIREHCRVNHDLAVIAIDLTPDQSSQLAAQDIRLFADVASIPRFASAPPHAVAMTCRPYLPQLFPGYDLYLWIDADVRIASPAAFDFYFSIQNDPNGIAICREDEPAYPFVHDPANARLYHDLRRKRVTQTFGPDAAATLLNQYAFNAGVFAMHRDCPTWSHYRDFLEHAMKHPYDRMLEQDALMLALLRHPPSGLRVGPSTFNWLCSVATPAFDPQRKLWVHPQPPHEPINVLHLTNSLDRVPLPGVTMTMYDYYRRIGLVT